MRDYQESVTTGQTQGRTEAGQSDQIVCGYALQATKMGGREKEDNLILHVPSTCCSKKGEGR